MGSDEGPSRETTCVTTAASSAGPGVLRRLFERLLGPRRRRTFDFVSLRFERCDVDGLAAELRLRERAIENGRADIPATEDVQRDGSQQQILNHVNGIVSEVVSEAKVRLAHQEERIATLQTSVDLEPLGNVVPRYERDLEALREEHRHERSRLEESVDHARRAVEAFRARHRLRWDPDFPESHLLHVAVLLLILILETAMNGSFFARGHELGLIGGISRAVAIAFANVLFCFAFGRLAAQARLGAPARRALGVAALVAIAAWTVGYNLAVAHLRDALASNPDEATRIALGTLAARPFGLQDFDSWVLFLVGSCFSLVAFGDGWKWDGAVPGFAGVRRRLSRAEDALLDLSKEIRGRGRSAYRAKQGELDRVLGEARSRLSAFESAVRTREALVENVRGCIRHYEESCNALVKTYQDYNRQHRSTPPPAYFQAEWTYPVPAELHVDTGAERAKLEALRGRVDAAGAAVERARNELSARLAGFEATLGGDAAPAAPAGRPGA